MSTTNDAYVTEGLTRLLQQFDGSVNLRALASVFLDQCQTLEDAAFPLLAQRSIDNAAGDRLDRIGALVSVTRSGRTDTVYRTALKGEIGVLTSRGTAEDMLDVVQLFIQMGTPDYEMQEYFPKGFTLRPVDNPISESLATLTGSALDRAISAGTTMGFIYAYLTDPFLFTLATQGAVLDTSSTQGLGPIYEYGGLYDWDTGGIDQFGLGPGEFRFNNTDPAKATKIFVHDTDKGPTDRNAFHDALTGNNLLIEKQTTSDKGFYCHVVTSTDSGVYHTLDIEKPMVIGSNVSGDTYTIKSLNTGGSLTGVK